MKYSTLEGTLMAIIGVLTFSLVLQTHAICKLNRRVTALENISHEKTYEITNDTTLDTLAVLLNSTPQEHMELALEYFGVSHPEIVHKQALLETGHYTSQIYQNKNNCFGLYNSRKKEYYSFDHWVFSVQGYKEMIQNRYNGGDYYEFLTKLGYAEDPNYINKLKSF